MEPTYMPQSLIIIKNRWLAHKIEKGDVVVLRDPRNDNLILKRVGKIEKESYFMLGDNERESTDSRVFGLISKENIIGKVIFPKP